MSRFAVGLIALVTPMSLAAQSLPNEIIGHKLRVPGDAVEGTTAKLSEVEADMVAALPPQQQAERLLQYAISRHIGATNEIKARVDGWRGVITSTPSMGTLLDVARNGADLRVRAGMLTRAQRMLAIPGLIEMVEDKALSSGDVKYGYRALREITDETLPDDPQQWRDWYAAKGAETTERFRKLQDHTPQP